MSFKQCSKPSSLQELYGLEEIELHMASRGVQIELSDPLPVRQAKDRMEVIGWTNIFNLVDLVAAKSDKPSHAPCIIRTFTPPPSSLLETFSAHHQAPLSTLSRDPSHLRPAPKSASILTMTKTWRPVHRGDAHDTHVPVGRLLLRAPSRRGDSCSGDRNMCEKMRAKGASKRAWEGGLDLHDATIAPFTLSGAPCCHHPTSSPCKFSPPTDVPTKVGGSFIKDSKPFGFERTTLCIKRPANLAPALYLSIRTIHSDHSERPNSHISLSIIIVLPSFPALSVRSNTSYIPRLLSSEMDQNLIWSIA